MYFKGSTCTSSFRHERLRDDSPSTARATFSPILSAVSSPLIIVPLAALCREAAGNDEVVLCDCGRAATGDVLVHARACARPICSH